MWTLLTFLFGVVTGVALVGAGVWYILSFFFVDPDAPRSNGGTSKATIDGRKVGLPTEPTSATFQLPPVLISKISDESCKSKESCWALNFVLYFLFRELRNSEGIRRWVLRKLSLEFEELLATTVLGKFFSSISIQNIDLGQNFPVLSWLKTSNVELHPVFKNISTLDILVDLDYSGGFQFSIQAETHLRHSAYLSVQFNEVKGQARLQFQTEPYAHWSFSFAENPEIDISVVSQLYGKSFSHITSMIASQLKRSVRKKHTLPMYKIRYKPFFSRVEHIIAALVPNSAPRAEVKGNLTMTLIECRGLMSSLLGGNVYSTLALGDFDWVAAYDDGSGSISIVRDLVYVKTGRRETNLDFTLGMSNEFPIVESLNSATCKTEATTKQHLEFEIGDEILAVDGKKVTTVKMCVKNFKYSTSMKVIWRIRRKHYSTTLPKVEESARAEEEEDSFVLISPTTTTADGLSSDNGVPSSSGNNGAETTTTTTTPTINVSAPATAAVSPTTSNILSSATTAAKKEKMELPIISTSATPSVSSTTTTAAAAVNSSSTPTSSRRSSFVPEISVDSAFISQGENGVSVATTVVSSSSTEESSTGGINRGERTDRPTTGYGFRNSLYDSRQCYVVRTGDLPCSRDPIFTESFDLKVEESHRFINLAVWSAKCSPLVDLTNSTTNNSSTTTTTTTTNSGTIPSSPTSSPSKRSKTALANLESITFNNDRLIGTLSIPIADVVAECGTTGMGYFVKDYYLRSPDGTATEAKDNLITTHSGFEPHMCYGKISLSFLFKSDEDAASSSKRRDSLDSISSGPPIEIATDALSEANNPSPTEDFQTHHFVRTNFRTYTVCDYCNKKIWLKEAFACRICHMKCHKKCNDRCIANTICRGEGFYPSIPNMGGRNSSQITPEIITTGEDEIPEDDDTASLSNYSVRSLQPNQSPAATASGSNGVRRRTLGGLIVSAVQNRSLTMRRAGSATNLLSPNQNSNATSKSLPPSPQASPTTNRKVPSTSMMTPHSGQGLASQDINPFEVLSAGGFGSSEQDINTAVEHIIQNPNDDLVAMAKETGRDVYSDLSSLTERKQKLNHVLNRLQEEIDTMSSKRHELMKPQPNQSQSQTQSGSGLGRRMEEEICACDERVQALALLMLYYCAGLQQVQDLEEVEKDDLLISLSLDEDQGDEENEENSTE